MIRGGNEMKKMLSALLIGGALFAGPAMGHAAFGDTVLKQGMTNDDVEQVKTVLKDKGFLKGEVSRYFNYETKKAVMAFQEKHNLEADGVVGENTYNALGKDGVVEGESEVNTDKVITKAKSLMGTPYKWGGTTPSGFDCSGYLQYVYKESVGIDIPRTVEDIYKAGENVSEPQVGDLVFFETYKEGPSHAGIYLGDGKFINASSSKGVTISDKNSSYWKERYIGAKRITAN